MGSVRNSLATGIERSDRYTVTTEMTAPHLPRAVLATPAMIGLIEQTCLMAVLEHLDDGETTVGTHVCVSHEAAAGVDEEITIHCRLDTIERRRLTFEVEVDGDAGRLSEGTHERAVISLDRFA